MSEISISDTHVYIWPNEEFLEFMSQWKHGVKAKFMLDDDGSSTVRLLEAGEGDEPLPLYIDDETEEQYFAIPIPDGVSFRKREFH